MATTITYTVKGTDYYFTLAEINALFAQIKTVVDGKLDVRGDTVGADIRGVGCSIINVPEPEATGDLLRNT